MDCTHTAHSVVFAHTCKDQWARILASARLFCVFDDRCKDRCPDFGQIAGSRAHLASFFRDNGLKPIARIILRAKLTNGRASSGNARQEVVL
jgi:hypothetical protein